MLSKRILAFSILALFVAMVIFGLHASMMTDKDGNMSKCPLTNGISSICPMNVFEHIGAWHSLLTTIISVIILFFFALTFLSVSSLFKNLNNVNSMRNRFLLYRRESFTFRPFDYLRLVFRKGILNPKVFSFVSISR